MSASDQPQRPRNVRGYPLKSEASPAANVLRLVLRAHSRAPGGILAAREDFVELWYSAAEPHPKRSATGPRSQRVGWQGSGGIF